MNNILYGQEAKKALLKGVHKLSRAVKSTFGAGGKNVLIQEPYTGNPLITKDGITVAKAVHSDDEFETQAINIVRDVALATNKVAGDGTTNSIVLAESLIDKGVEILSEGGINSVAFKRGMDKALTDIVHNLEKMAKPARTLEALEDIAKVSNNGDEELAEIIAKAVFSVGNYGSVKIAPNKNHTTYIETRNGLVLDGGVIDPMFLPANQSQVELEDAYVVVTNYTLQSINDFGDSQDTNGLNVLLSSGKPVVVFCENIATGFAQQLIKFIKTGPTQLYVVKCPDFGQERVLTMGNIATLTNGAFFDAGNNVDSLKTMTIGHVGIANRVTISNYETTLITDSALESDIIDRQHYLESLLGSEEYPKNVVEQSIAKLLGLSCIIHVGANSQLELKEKLDRVEDAVNATTSAYKEGVVPGGGVALANCGRPRSKNVLKDFSEAKGYGCVISVMFTPVETILSNAGIDKKPQDWKKGRGIDVRTGKEGDMINMGIIDPLITIKTALTNAVSIAGTLLTTDCVITQTPEKTTTNFI